MFDHSKPENLKPLEFRLALLTLLASLVPSGILLALLWYSEASVYLIGIVAVLLLFLVLYCVSTVWRQAQHHFQSVHNLLDAIVRGDYSFRGAHAEVGGAFEELIKTINALAQTIQRQRTQSEESQLLVQKVVDQIDVAIIAWDQSDQLQLVNPAASRLLSEAPRSSIRAEAMLKLPGALAFANTLQLGETVVRDLVFGAEQGRYRLHLEQFITAGSTHRLLFLTNISSILRVEERRAWRNLVRVLSHEINNSLSPLKSYSDALTTQIEKRESDAALKQELLEGMKVIGNRSASLANFVQSYHKIARLPAPQKQERDFRELVEGLIRFFPDARVTLDGQSIAVPVDAGQIEQVLINLIKNALEASANDEEINVSWQQTDQQLRVSVRDHGAGIHSQENLFTPYYTTKPSGSGIGLVFCQQVIEAHGGYLSLVNRDDTDGCEATFNLPFGRRNSMAAKAK